jgi:acetoacetate decarboxylase
MNAKGNIAFRSSFITHRSGLPQLADFLSTPLEVGEPIVQIE